MPVYSYIADDGESMEKCMTVAEMTRRSAKDWSIRERGKKWKRDLGAEHGGFRNVSCANWPLLSDAFGVPPHAVPKAKRWSEQLGTPIDFTGDGQAIFESAAHRRAVLKSHGKYDRSGYD